MLPNEFLRQMMEECELHRADMTRHRRTFVASALKAEQEVAQYGLVHDADEVFGYIKAKVEGRTTKRPKAHKL